MKNETGFVNDIFLRQWRPAGPAWRPVLWEWLVAPNERSTSSVTKTLLPFPFSGAINFDVLAFGVAFL